MTRISTVFVGLSLLLSFVVPPIHASELDILAERSLRSNSWESLFETGGWIEFGVYSNAHGAASNGPMHTAGNRRTDFHVDQLYLFHEKTLNSRRFFDIGYRADLVYGVDAPGMQSNGDGSFDDGWGLNRHGYALSLYQLYGTVSLGNLTVKGGKFITPVGWESTASLNNFFYSHSYCFWIEPSTHVGFVADYKLSDRLTISGGWTTGNNVGFENKYDDSGFLFGLTCKLTKNATVYYWMTLGKTENGFRRGEWRFDDGGALARQDFFVQSLCLEWTPTERFTYVMQYNLRNDSDVEANTFRSVRHYSSYGINNHFLYRLNDRWGVGLRLEWLRDNGGDMYFTNEPGDYFQMTFGLNWNPCSCWSVRPEIRYDRVVDGSARPFDDGREREQFSGGIGVLYRF